MSEIGYKELQERARYEGLLLYCEEMGTIPFDPRVGRTTRLVFVITDRYDSYRRSIVKFRSLEHVAEALNDPNALRVQREHARKHRQRVEA
jgi:hypothetical protein